MTEPTNKPIEPFAKVCASEGCSAGFMTTNPFQTICHECEKAEAIWADTKREDYGDDADLLDDDIGMK